MKKSIFAVAIVLLIPMMVLAQAPKAAQKPAPKPATKYVANPAVKGNFCISLPLFGYTKGGGDLNKDSSWFNLGVLEYDMGVEYFIFDNVSVGGALGYQSEKTGGSSIPTTTFMPMASYYYYMGKQIIPYGGVGILYQTTKEEITVPDIWGNMVTQQYTVKTTSLALKAGALYMLGLLNKNIAGFGEILLAYDSMSNGSSVSGNRIGISLGLKVFF